MSKTIKHAAEVIKAIKAEVSKDVIKDHEMPTLCNFDTGKDTGFAVILTLSTKYEYTNEVLEDWMKRFEADDYTIKVRSNRLNVRFNVMYGKK